MGIKVLPGVYHEAQDRVHISQPGILELSWKGLSTWALQLPVLGRYQQVLHCCSLSQDLETLPFRDLTEVSGGALL